MTKDEILTNAPLDARPRTIAAARAAVRAVFFANGLAMATWVVNIPRVRDQLDLNPATVGTALLGIAVGSLVAMPRTGHLTARYGTRLVTLVAGVLVALTLLLPFVAPSLPLLFAALLVFGAANGVMDVAMNAQGVVVERAGRKPVMSSFHAAFSFGTLAGALLGSFLLGEGVAALPHALLVSAGFLALLGVVGRLLLPKHEDTAERPSEDATANAPVRHGRSMIVLLGVLCFLGMLGEGAIGDWSGLYSTDVLKVSGGLVGAAFTAFTLAMTVARLLGDGWRSRHGDARVVTFGALLSGVGLLLGLLTLNPLLAALGFLVFGIGVANVVPVLYGTAGHAFAGKGIAMVASIGYAGFLAGPPLIGFVSHELSLRVGMIVIAASLLAVGACAPLVYRRLSR
ncbi:MFS transporter [Deinococcus yavapaiensis]|uniref:Putative MFS family arabinose efflux permease n=1 Tax=Deinococcus yavapaiensis KR-236 TaxID=694435 RepID=A0A318SC25_9DEIO|nr:MFS transporter [Deinococcus yavapaiensis]PYE48651.1 putative MFS family arabinose efflux permease [Deinococcus yavapaiensis KR-236]